MLALIEQDVRRLYVAMNEALRVRRVERVRDLRDDREPAPRLESTLLAEQRAQVRSLDEPHHEVQLAVELARVVDRHRVRVLERHRELGLALEALSEALVEREVRRDQLQRDRAFQALVVRAVDDTHAALTGERLDPVPEDLTADADRVGGIHSESLSINHTAATARLQTRGRP